MTKASDTATGLSILAQWKKPVPPEPDVLTEVPGGITPYCPYARGEVTFVTPSEAIINALDDEIRLYESEVNRG